MVSREKPAPLDDAEAAMVGMCATCCHARRIVSAKGSAFWLCERALAEPTRFRKYPRLPVLHCAGFGEATLVAPTTQAPRG